MARPGRNLKSLKAHQIDNAYKLLWDIFEVCSFKSVGFESSQIAHLVTDRSECDKEDAVPRSRVAGLVLMFEERWGRLKMRDCGRALL